MTEDQIKIIREFTEGTEEWTQSMIKMQQFKACAMCGIIPEKLRELSEAIKALLKEKEI